MRHLVFFTEKKWIVILDFNHCIGILVSYKKNSLLWSALPPLSSLQMEFKDTQYKFTLEMFIRK